MRSALRLVLRAVFLLVVVALLATGAFLAWLKSERAEKTTVLAGESTLATTELGTVEYRQTGEGMPVLVLHGALGGFDQAELLVEGLSPDNFEVLSPSRPGYLRTPLATGLSPSQQADAMAALLDTLKIPAVSVVGFSNGAPVAMEFARRHAARTKALVLVSPVVKRLVSTFEKPRLPSRINDALTGEVGAWYVNHLAGRDPGAVLRATADLSESGTETEREVWVRSVLSNPEQTEWFQRLVGTLVPLTPREDGLRNDLVQMGALPEDPVAGLNCPTLFVHGALDSFVPFADVQAASARIPGAKVIEVSNAGHLVFLGPASSTIWPSIAAFLSAPAAAPAP
jgi:pimeloyl-ACP methyl ester carboxylesterase